MNLLLRYMILYDIVCLYGLLCTVKGMMIFVELYIFTINYTFYIFTIHFTIEIIYINLF